MSKITLLKLNRKFQKVVNSNGIDIAKRNTPIRAFKREEVKCPRCGRIHLISVGQLVKCPCTK